MSMRKCSYSGGGILEKIFVYGGHIISVRKKMTFLGSKILVMKLTGLNWVLVVPIILTPFGGLWLGNGFWMMLVFGGGLVGVGSNDTLPSSMRS